jgi:hypothetical protein
MYLLHGRKIVPEPLFEDLQDQIFEEPQLFFTDQQASLFEHVSPMINFSTYSVELELHDRKV